MIIIHLSDTTQKLTKRAAPDEISLINFLFGLAPVEVYLATEVAFNAGELLPHRFTLTSSKKSEEAVCFLLHFLWIAPGFLISRLALWCPDFPPRLKLSCKQVTKENKAQRLSETSFELASLIDCRLQSQKI
jgi:hypothetical protein